MRFDAVWRYAGRTGTIRDVDVTWSERWAVDGGADLRRVALSLPIPADVDVPALVASGVPLSTMTVALSATSNGTTREVMSGALRASSYDLPGAPVEGELGDVESDDLGTVPPFLVDGSAASVVDAVSWPNSPETSRGAVYPWPFGTSVGVPSSPAIVVDSGDKLLLVAGAPVGGTCYIWGPKYPGAEKYRRSSLLTVGSSIDGRGQAVATVDGSAFGESGEPSWDEDLRYWVEWVTEPTSGRLDRFAQYLLALSSLDIDHAAQSAAMAGLSRYQVAGYLDDGQAPSALLQELLGQVPAYLRRGDSGVYVEAMGVALESAPVAATLTVGMDAHRDGPVRLIDDEPVARVRLEYAYDQWRERYVSSVDLVRARRGRTVEASLGHVYDPATAEAMAEWMLTEGGRWRELGLFVDDDRFGWGAPRELRAGAVVQLVDAERSLNDRARVVSIERDRGGMRVTLRMRG